MVELAAGNATAVAAAIQGGPVGVSFGGAGFLIFYYIGIVEVLSKLGVLSPASKLAGSSSGALITTSQCSGLAPPDIFSAGHALAKACRSANSCSGTLDRELRRTLESHLPDDAWKRCRNAGWISISAGTPIGPSEPLLVSDFTSKEDLISAAATSSYIPLWSSPSFTAMFRGLQAFDGGYTLYQPCPPDVSYCIRISTRNPVWPQNRGIGSFISLLGRLGGGGGGGLLAEAGVAGEDGGGAEAAAPRSYPPIESTGPGGAPDPQLVKLAAESGVDIAPGVFNRVPFSQSEWSDWAMSPADDGTIKHMVELGRKDAAAWARHVGIAVAKDGKGEAAPAPAAPAAKPKAGRRLMAA